MSLMEGVLKVEESRECYEVESLSLCLSTLSYTSYISELP